MLRTQLFSPDTCGCEIHEEWDDATSNETRAHAFHRMEKTCSAHQHLSGEAVYQQVMNENRRKNTLAVIAKQVRPQFDHDDYQWEFDEQRRLVVKVAGFSQAHLKSLKDSADIQFGPGLVILEINPLTL